MTEAQILVGREYQEGTNKGINFYQLMVNWNLEKDTNSFYLPDTSQSVTLEFDIHNHLSQELVRRGITNCRVYNGIRYNSETKKFVEIRAFNQLEETAIKQSLKIVAGILAE